MPIARFQLEDGRIARFEVPEGTTPEQVQSAMQGFDFSMKLQPQAQQPQSIGRTALDQGLQGATFGFADEVSDRIGAGIASLATGEKYGNLLQEARGMSKQRMAEQMEQNPATAIAANIGGALLTGGVGATTKAGTATANMLRTGGTAARIGKGAVAGATSGALYGAGASEEGKRLAGAGQGAIFGGAVGGAIPGIGAALGGAKKVLTPVADEGFREVGKLAQKYNIPLSLDQIANSRALKNIQKISQEIPLSGQQAFRERQMKAFNAALFKTVGVKADRFTPENMGFAFKKVGGEFDSLTKGQSFNIGESFINDVASTADEVASTYGKEAAEIYQREALKVINDFSKGDNISGELISRQRARINAMARKAGNPDIKGALLDLENNIVDGITGGSPEIQAALSSAKQRYKNLIVLEPIANKAKGGMISPSLLNGRVSQVYKRAHTIGNSGEIGDLARVGNELLPELGGSDTTQKMAYIGALATGASNPTSIPLLGATVGANRAFQSGVNRNQSLINSALDRALPQTKKAVSPILSGPAGGGAGAIGAMESRPVRVNPVPESQPVNLTPLSPQSNNQNFFDNIKQAESGGNPKARAQTSSASGLYQFTDQTWKDSVDRWGKKYGITQADKNNPQAQEILVRELAADNAKILTSRIGRQPNIADMYIAHVFGAKDSIPIIKNADKNKVAFLLASPKVVRANKSLFYDKGKPRTTAQLYALLSKKMNQV